MKVIGPLWVFRIATQIRWSSASSARHRQIKSSAGQPAPATMAIHINQVMLQPIIALIAGIPILVVPRILNYIVAIYLIIVGVLGLWSHLLR